MTALWLVWTSCLIAAEPDPQIETLQPGVRLTLVAEHPDLVTPTGVDVDRQGRIWTVATHTHFRPEDYVGPERDEVLVFVDSDGDGRADERQVFYNSTIATMDLELGSDGWVYLAERDRILRIKDRDGDGRADLREDIAVLETEADYPHNGLSGLAWHPDGDLVFGLGENYAKEWTLTGSDGSQVQGTGEGGIFRCTADGRHLRRIAQGLWNPFGVCVRSDGEIFAAENDPGARPPCRLLHIVEGGDYGFQRLYGPEAHHPFVCWNGQLRGTLPMIHPTGEAPCGVLPLGGGVIVTTWTNHRIDFYPLRREGASFTSQRVVLLKGGNHFRPVCIARDDHHSDALDARPASDPDSSPQNVTFFLTDWVYVSYQLHRRGRLWRLDIDPVQATWIDPRQPELPNRSARLMAQLRRGDRSFSQERTLELSHESDPFLAQAALVALAREAPRWRPAEVAGWPTTDRISAVQAIKLAAASGATVNLDIWVHQFLKDSSREVQFETLRWIADAQLPRFLPDVKKLLLNQDLDFRLFEAIAATTNTLIGKASEGVRNTELLFNQVRNESASPALRAFALRLLPKIPRVAAGDESAPVQPLPKGLTINLLLELLDVQDERLSMEVIRVLAGNPTSAAQRVLAGIAAGSEYSTTIRIEAIAGLAAVAEKHTGLLVRRAGDVHQGTREEALRALRGVALEKAQVRHLKSIAEDYPESADLVRAVLDPASLTRGRPALNDIEGWKLRLDKIEEEADPGSGQRIFHHARIALCARCHRHQGRGNVVGPDLSQVGHRQDRGWLLESLLQPNRSVAPEYRARTLVLADGRTFTGIHLRTGGGGDVETLRDSNGQERRFPRNEIEMSEEVLTSLMPERLPDTLTDRELRDLIAFLEQSVDSEHWIAGNDPH